jgi:hypothetical protein
MAWTAHRPAPDSVVPAARCGHTAVLCGAVDPDLYAAAHRLGTPQAQTPPPPPPPPTGLGTPASPRSLRRHSSLLPDDSPLLAAPRTSFAQSVQLRARCSAAGETAVGVAAAALAAVEGGAAAAARAADVGGVEGACMVVCGGIGASGRCLADLWRFDFGAFPVVLRQRER